MTVITEKSKRSGRYHIKVVGARSQLLTESGCQAKINSFLSDLFDLDGSGNDASPLEFCSHDPNEGTNNTGSPNVVLVRLKVSRGARKTLDQAAQRFCELVFEPRASSILGTVTIYGLLGISTLSGPFKQPWTKAFFSDCIKNGSRLLRAIDKATHNYLPDWALTLSFVAVAGLGFAVGAFAGSACGPVVGFGAGSAVVVIGTSILVKYVFNKPNGSLEIAEHETNWMGHYDEFTRCLRTVSQELGKAGNPEKLGNSQLHQHVELCDALYETTEVASKIFTFNRQSLEVFMQLRNNVTLDTIWTGLVAGATRISSLATCGVVGQDAAHTSIQKYHDTKKERLGCQKRIEYHKEMDKLIARAWQLTYETHTLLRWVHITPDTSVDDSIEFVECHAQPDWAQVIATIRTTRGAHAMSDDLGPRIISNFLSEQSTSLDKVIESIETATKELKH